MGRIATLTVNPSIDLNTTASSVVPEHKIRCGQPRREPGGGGLNVARAVTRLGGQAHAIWTSGGPTGHLLAGLLDREALDHSPIPVNGLTRENIIVYEESSGKQYRFGMPGPPLDHDARDRLVDSLRHLEPVPEILVASGSLPPGLPTDFYARIARAGRKLACKVVIDTSGDALKLAAQAGVWLLKPNVRELGQLVGQPLEDEVAVEEAARDLVKTGGAEAVLVSLGAAGAMLVTEELTSHIRSPVVPVRSKVGAGDSAVAGVVLATARGWGLLEAARFGVAAGAAAVMTAGTELCRREDAERIYGILRGEASEGRTVYQGGEAEEAESPQTD